MQDTPNQRIYEFGNFRLDGRKRLVERDREVLPLTPKMVETLLALVERAGEVVDKDTLMERVWPGTFVEESNLTYNISVLRKVLRGNDGDQSYIETLPRRGYRFTCPVKELSVSGDSQAPIGGTDEERSVHAPNNSERLGTERDNGNGIGGTSRDEAQHLATVSQVEPIPDSPTLETSEPTSTAKVSRRTMALMVSVGAAIVVLSWVILQTRQRPTDDVMYHVQYLTAYQGMESQPALSPDGRQVAFTWDGERGDNWDVYVKVVGTDSRLRLTKSPSQETSPAWSPDGSLIAFQKNTGPGSGIYVMSALGGVERKIASAFPVRAHHRGRSLDWTPDGRFLVVTDRESSDEPFGLYKIDAQNGARTRLLAPKPPSTGVMALAVSPNGAHVAFSRLNDGHADHARAFMDLYLMSLDGGTPRRLTFDDEFVIGMTWTPDSQEIVFGCFRSAKQSYEWGSTLWRVPYRGGEPRLVSSACLRAYNPSISRNGNRLAYEERSRVQSHQWRQQISVRERSSSPPIKILAAGRTDFCPQISPDSSRLAMVSSRSGKAEIWVCSPDVTDEFQLTNLDVGTTAVPRWSPDGTRIVFRSDGARTSGIYIVDVASRVHRRLDTGNLEDSFPNWAGDGRWIYFSSKRTGSQQIWKVPSEGGQPVQVTQGGGEESQESPDGRFLYFTRYKGLSWTYRDSSLWKIPTAGGPESLVLKSIHLGFWGVTQQGICYLDTSGREDLPFPFQFLDFSSGKSRTLHLREVEPMWNYSSVSVSRDGRWMLFHDRERMQRDLMLVENFR